MVCDAVGMIALLPYFAGEYFAGAEGESALDQLRATFDRHVRGGCEQDVDVVRHYDEGVELEFAGVAVAEESSDEEFGGFGALEETAALVGDSGEGVGLRFQAHMGGRVPGAEAPCFSVAG